MEDGGRKCHCLVSEAADAVQARYVDMKVCLIVVTFGEDIVELKCYIPILLTYCTVGFNEKGTWKLVLLFLNFTNEVMLVDLLVCSQCC